MVQTVERLGKRIRELRLEKGMTQERLAEMAALSAQHVVDLEHGRTNPTVASLFGIARAFRMKMRDLFESV